MVAGTAEYLVYSLPHSSMDYIVPFFRKYEKMRAQADDEDAEDDGHKPQPIIVDCAISHTSKCVFFFPLY